MPSKANTKPNIISFRVTDVVYGLLEAFLAKNTMHNATSTRTLARRVVVDFARGRLAYKDPSHVARDPEVMLEAEADEASLRKGAKGARRSRRPAAEALATAEKTRKGKKQARTVRKPAKAAPAKVKRAAKKAKAVKAKAAPAKVKRARRSAPKTTAAPVDPAPDAQRMPVAPAAPVAPAETVPVEAAPVEAAPATGPVDAAAFA